MVNPSSYVVAVRLLISACIDNTVPCQHRWLLVHASADKVPAGMYAHIPTYLRRSVRNRVLSPDPLPATRLISEGGALDVREEGGTSFVATVDSGTETRRQYWDVRT